MSATQVDIQTPGRKPALYLGTALGVFLAMGIAIIGVLLSGKADLERRERYPGSDRLAVEAPGHCPFVLAVRVVDRDGYFGVV